MRVYKSLKVWSVYADLEESYGTFQVSLLHRVWCIKLCLQRIPDALGIMIDRDAIEVN